MDGVLSAEDWADKACASGPADWPLLIGSAGAGRILSAEDTASTGLLLLRPTPARCNQVYMSQHSSTL